MVENVHILFITQNFFGNGRDRCNIIIVFDDMYAIHSPDRLPMQLWNFSYNRTQSLSLHYDTISYIYPISLQIYNKS